MRIVVTELPYQVNKTNLIEKIVEYVRDKKLEGILTDIKKKHSDIFIDRVECVGVEQLADSGVILKFIADVEEAKIFSGRRLLNKELKIHFDKEHIEIPFPQVDIHTK